MVAPPPELRVTVRGLAPPPEFSVMAEAPVAVILLEVRFSDGVLMNRALPPAMVSVIAPIEIEPPAA